MRLVVLAVILVAPTIGYQLWASSQSRQRAIAWASTRVEELARLAAAEEDDSLQEASNLLRVLKHVPAIINGATEECHALLREITNEHPRVNAISVIRPDGSIACTSAQPVPPAISVADRPWFQEATAADAPSTVISELLTSRTTGVPGVIVAAGLPSLGADTPSGALSALMDLAWFSSIASRISGSTGASIQIVDDRSGTVIAQSAGPSERHPVPLRLLNRIRSAPSGVTEVSSFGGEAEIVGYQRLPADQDSHSVVTVTLRKTVVLSNASRYLLLGLTTAAATLLCGILIAWYIAKVSIIKPISDMAQMAARVSSGDLGAEVRPDGFSVVELRILGCSFNAAVEQVRLRDTELEHLTLRDALTGISNRRCFDITIEREWLQAKQSKATLALLMVDVDHFKRYNDHYGHPAGDQCLRRVARAIADRARSTLDLVARYGGEEIVLLVPNIDVQNAMELAERLVSEVRGLGLPHSASPTGWLSVSVGVAVLGPDNFTGSPQSLIESADQALYRAKRSGRNCAVGAAELPNHKSQDHLSMLSTKIDVSVNPNAVG